MELKSIETSRVVFLTDVARPAGQLFLPAAAAALVGRYRFQKYPAPDQLLGESFTFGHGLFNGIAISELSIYQDGMLAASKSNTAIIDAFIGDLLQWAAEELGLKVTGIPPQERHYESNLVVAMDIQANRALPMLDGIARSLTAYQELYQLRPFAFDFGAFSIVTDATAYTGRKPVPFTLARRVNVPFEAGIFFSTAPLKTDDHVAILRKIEGELS